jgi:nitrate/nitrite transporter NarK
MKDNIVKKVWGWVSDRITEPSSWAAVAAVLVGLSFLLSLSWMVWIGIVAAIAALVIGERGSGGTSKTS